ncbi:TIGR03862 family flavoprotein [Parvularcula lutaonensis]|uniref:TIGR03862 family flavoprotein n=1 Tax=Parvularcula lutaonensis TaxID=491923 RepID=A0ABV7ME43_9PROT|nr:TIGR03862 family flavoprotein [Parvularcula lutaonensis]GGY54590.1 hypothetical protein GCM10007148_25330 [Parvularcula lutaonensis]
MSKPFIAIVGAGPAGLMAAEAADARGAKVAVYDQMPSPARKFLMAGKSGLNITHTEEPQHFLERYRDARIADIVRDFGGADAVRGWMTGLGIAETVGSTGRVFPKMMKASPLLRAWLARLEGEGVEIWRKHRLTGWNGAKALTFETPDGVETVEADAVIFAAGGGSWRRLGSDGAWAEIFASAGIEVAPFRPSNVGLLVPWSEHMLERFEGAPVKNVRITAPNGEESRGEFVITKRGIESGGIYPVSRAVDEAGGDVSLLIDLVPDRNAQEIAERLSRQNPKQSLSNRLRKAVKIAGVKAALFREGVPREVLTDDAAIAAALKAVPLSVSGTVPLDEAISTRGGVPWEALNPHLMLKDAPGVYCAGEMIDWDAPTGGYLLTACLATGWLAGEGAAAQ